PHHMMNQMSSNAGPMTRTGKGMPAGLDMNNGMGMLNGAPGAPAGEDYGPSIGRGMGVGSTQDQTVGNAPLSSRSMAGMQMGTKSTGGMPMDVNVSKDANAIPGFPQDAFMESPMMAMDEKVAKPQNYGLRPGWSGFMQGMMTFVRVLPPAEYDQVMERIGK
ncbi:MAG: copper oxidase, partial [Bryobacteraceae bacterium]